MEVYHMSGLVIFTDYLNLFVSPTGQGVIQRVCHHVKPSRSVECFDFPIIFFSLEPLRYDPVDCLNIWCFYCSRQYKNLWTYGLFFTALHISGPV